MVISSRPPHVFFSLVFAVLLLASTAAAQDMPSGAPIPADATALTILNLSSPARPTPEKMNGEQDALFDFRLPRMKPVGLIPSSDRVKGSMATDGAGATSGAFRITLDEAQARAISIQAVVLTAAGVDAAHFHHKALQSEYFPKVSAYLVNIHYNKFMGETVQLFARRPLIPTFSRNVPLFDKDQTFVGPTVTQPLTPIFKIHEAVRIAKADERIAEAKAYAASAQLTADVERAYFDLLIAQRRQTEAGANVEIAERRLQIASAAALPVGGAVERETELLEAQKALLAASDKVTELTRSLADLIGLPETARLELAPPPPVVIEADFSPQPPQKTLQAAPSQKPRPVIAIDPEIVEAEEGVVKAKAARRLAKLEYLPDAAITGGYMFQTGVPLLPDDFSWIGVIATWTIFDFGKRERTIKERDAQVTMARANLELVRAKATAGAQKTVMDVDRTRRILELTRKVVSMQRAMAPRDQDAGPEAKAVLANVEAEMFQAELDYRMARAQLKRAAGEQ
jgi:outer membrane protein TolC